jgi:ERI1 exoribonuclease 3
MKFRYACILDFEATCDRVPGVVENEVIEFPGVLVDLETGAVVSEFQQYVKPVNTPKLTAFCTELTGITNEVIDSQGVLFPEALSRHRKWLMKETGARTDEELFCSENILFVTCGDWDLKVMLPAQLRFSEIPRNSVSYLRSWCNVKALCAFFWREKKQPGGMPVMLHRLGLTLEGKHHSGIDDCKNIAKIVVRLREQGCPFQATARLDEDDKVVRLLSMS